MSGIYLHIPFCKKACHYCNFHFSTSLQHRRGMTAAILKELAMRKDYLQGQALGSIYFGGGTPSLLPVNEIEQIIQAIYRQHPVLPDAEITLEANPDDMTPAWLADLKKYTPVNRLSIGIQSFFEHDLVWMNRAHQAAQGRAAIELAQENGFSNLTIDLIYGSPTTTDAQWAENLQMAFDYKIPHISCYCLTVEEGTALHHFVQKGKSKPVDDEQATRQFEYLLDAMAAHGYEQYEISNFAIPGMYARHNSNYWLGGHYLGVGPAAHSYNGHARQWNIANNALYLAGIESGVLRAEQEVLTPVQKANEYIMTMLRTQWGCSLGQVDQLLPNGASTLLREAAPFLAAGDLLLQENTLKLGRKGKFLADGIAASLFFEEN